jgi:hypothetical protein
VDILPQCDRLLLGSRSTCSTRKVEVNLAKRALHPTVRASEQVNDETYPYEFEQPSDMGVLGDLDIDGAALMR